MTPADLSTGRNGNCPRCLATYRESDFGTDGDGRLVLTHVCVRRQDYTPKLTAEEVQRRKERRQRSLNIRRIAWLNEARNRRCVDCRGYATKYSDRCRKCQKSYRIRCMRGAA